MSRPPPASRWEETGRPPQLNMTPQFQLENKQGGLGLRLRQQLAGGGGTNHDAALDRERVEVGRALSMTLQLWNSKVELEGEELWR